MDDHYDITRIYGHMKGYGYKPVYPAEARAWELAPDTILDTVINCKFAWVWLCEHALYTLYCEPDLYLEQYVEAEGTVIWIMNLLEAVLNIEDDTEYQKSQKIVPFIEHELVSLVEEYDEISDGPS